MHPSRFARVAATAAAIVAAATIVPAQRTGPAVPAHPDDRTIAHVLNRIGFGPAPGDIGRVRQIGLEKYLDQQLHPERIPDPAMEARLGRFESLTKSTRELAADYFIPAMLE